MEKILRPVWAEIDLDALAYNMKNIKALAKDKEVIAVVKADCYGHGSVDTAPVLLENGASRLAVAVLTEGIELRNAGITAPIMILGYTPEYLGKELIEYDIEQTVYSLEYAHNLSETALSLNKKPGFWPGFLFNGAPNKNRTVDESVSIIVYHSSYTQF